MYTFDAVHMLCEREEARLECLRNAIINHIKYDMGYVAELARKAVDIESLVADLRFIIEQVHPDDWELQINEWRDEADDNLRGTAAEVDAFIAWNT